MPTTSVVVDASVALKWLFNEADRPQALRLPRQYQSGDIRLLAPDLLILEVGNALWKRTARGLLDGEIITDAAHTLRLPVQVFLGGSDPLEVLYAGAAPGLPAGVIQINVRIPEVLSAHDMDAGWSAISIRAGYVGKDLIWGPLVTVAVK